MHTHHTTHHGSVSRICSDGPRRRQAVIALATVTLGVVATACGSDTDAIGAATDGSATATETVTTEPEPVVSDVVIDIVLDLNNEIGEFVVSDGADALGCDGGRFYLSANDQNLSFMRCNSGSNTGEFQMLIDPTLGDDETFTGTWKIFAGTEDFETLSGSGEFEGVRDIPARSIIGTRTGEIQFAAAGG